MSKIKILITGCLGFIGSNAARFLLKESKDYEIVGIDYAVEPKLLHAIHLNKNNTFYLGNITDSHFINNVLSLEKPDVIIHMADTKLPGCVDTNVVGTHVLIENAIKHKIQKFVYISSDKVCGKISANENDHATPNTTYAVSKYSSELLLQVSGLNYVIIRPCNIFGPRQSEEYLIPYVIKSMIEERVVKLYNQGLNLRDYLYVTDFAAALKIILEKGTGPVYHVSSDWQLSSLDLYKNISDIFNMKDYPIEFNNTFKTDNERNIKCSDLKALGWKPEAKFKESLNTTINWYVNNYQWFLK